MSAGQRVAGAVPSKLLNSASLNEIRAGVYEHLMVLLQVGLTFPQQIKIMEATTTMFLAMRYFETSLQRGKGRWSLKKATINLWSSGIYFKT